MIALMQALVLILVAATGVAVVATRNTASQAIVLSLFGTEMAILFFLYQAPDVALSQVVVGTVALPILMLVAMAQIRKKNESGR